MRSWQPLGSTGLVAVLALVATGLLVLTGGHLVREYDSAASRLATPAATTEPADQPPDQTPSPLPTPSPASTSATPADPAAPSSSTSPSPPGELTTELSELLDLVEVVASRPNPPGYDRSCGPGEGCVFGTEWNDATDAPDSHNGCDTRNDVLRRDLTNLVIDPDTHGCVVLSGVLHDPYTGATINFERGYDTSIAVQIDHLIPLAAAWDLGAWRWSGAKRATFANDTKHELLAVDGPANMSKGDSTPASWLPPNKAFRCQYGIRYLRNSLHWGLPITAADAQVLGSVSRRCD